MLLQMGIHNFALIEQLSVSFAKGITIFTGETGAGKSILMDAFSVLLGERASAEFIRHGKDKFIIEGIFEVDAMPSLKALLEEHNILCEDGQLLLSRSFSRQGKSTILANDHPITVKTLREIGQAVADIHGQYSNQELLQAERHHLYLDSYGKEANQAWEAYQVAYNSYTGAVARLKALTADEAARVREIDMLRFQINEIEEAQLVIGEDLQITEELQRLDNYEYLHKVVSSAYNALREGRHPLLDILNEIKIELDGALRHDEGLKEVGELVSSAYFQLEEAAQALDRYGDSISYDEEKYAYCQQRDSLLYTLKKKYGETLDAVLRFQAEASERLDNLEHAVNKKEDLEAEVKYTLEEAKKALLHLTKVRLKHKEMIEKAMNDILHRLGMPNAQLVFAIEPLADELNRLGAKRIEMLFSANKGEGLLPLHKVASGGEISRIALAFKSVFNIATHKTLVFDEIDVGISGDIALSVAEQILSLGDEAQVFCITHLPQTACIATQHYHLSKQEVGERTQTTLRKLSETEHIQQIARMMSGAGFSDTALQTAKDMIAHFKKRQ